MSVTTTCLLPICSEALAWPEGRAGRPRNFCSSKHAEAFRFDRARLQTEVDFMASRPAERTTAAGRQHLTRTAQLRWQLLRYPDPSTLEAALGAEGT